MERFLHYFLSKKTDVELTHIALLVTNDNLEILYLRKREIMKKSPWNVQHFQTNMEIIRHYEEAIRQLEKASEKQAKE